MSAFKIVKKTAFDKNGAKGVNYILGVQGRVVSLSTLSFEDSNVTVAENAAGTHLEVQGELEVRKAPYTNSLGENVVGLQFLPKFGFSLSDV